MALGTLAAFTFAAKEFAAVTLHGTAAVVPPIITPVPGSFVPGPRPSRRKRENDEAFLIAVLLK